VNDLICITLETGNVAPGAPQAAAARVAWPPGSIPCARRQRTARLAGSARIRRSRCSGRTLGSRRALAVLTYLREESAANFRV